MDEEDDDGETVSPPALPPRQYKTEGNTKPTLPEKAKPVSYCHRFKTEGNTKPTLPEKAKPVSYCHQYNIVMWS